MSSVLRSMARSKAKDNMKREGLSKICKGDFFAKHWRDFVKSKAVKHGKSRGSHKILAQEAEHGRKSKARAKSAS